MSDLKTRLTAFILEKDLTYPKAGKLFGVGTNTIRNIVLDECKPNMRTAYKIEKVLKREGY